MLLPHAASNPAVACPAAANCMRTALGVCPAAKLTLRLHKPHLLGLRCGALSCPPDQCRGKIPADSFEGCDYVTPDMIANQVVKLNQAFNPSNFNFQLATTDYTNRTLWCGPALAAAVSIFPPGPSPLSAQESCKHTAPAAPAESCQSQACVDRCAASLAETSPAVRLTCTHTHVSA
jgi:hypothetical protein